MPKPKQINPSDKAKKSRVYRTKVREQRRFESPLREFIEIRYKNAFKEYVELYKLMDSLNPNKIDLKKCETFKQWKIDNQQPNLDILSTAFRQEDSEAERAEDYEVERAEDSEAERAEDYEVERAEDSEAERSEDSEAERTEDYEAERAEDSEAERGEDSEAEVSETFLAAQQLDDLVSEMMVDDQLRNLINVEEPLEDEGIELNLFDELDIQGV